LTHRLDERMDKLFERNSILQLVELVKEVFTVGFAYGDVLLANDDAIVFYGFDFLLVYDIGAVNATKTTGGVLF
jgi:hypothetical protein